MTSSRHIKVNYFSEVVMKKMYFNCRSVLSFFAAVFLLCSCSFTESKTSAQSADSSVVLMTWNAQNLFDGKDDGDEYDEFKVSSGWSAEKYMGRINSISAAIGAVEPRPDIFILQEIESVKVLEALAQSIPGDYSLSHFANNPGAAVGLGIISRLPLSETRVHSITINSQTTPRPVLEARVHSDNGDFVIFACHWKSKIGGDELTENVRMSSARVILRRIRELWKNEPELGIIIAGDLNENHDEFYRQGRVCALVPDDIYGAQITGCLDSEKIDDMQKDFFVLSKNKPPMPVHFPKGTMAFFSPWMADLENGSYYYKNNWETIDHLLISPQFFNNSGLEYERSAVVNNQHFANSSGIPVPYSMRTGAGLSDHLPLLLVLKTAH
jgi:endonuclease/exonuclease/phosphatase family metal-dependent hydrolase